MADFYNEKSYINDQPSGSIPFTHYLSKIERSNVMEDTDMYQKYARSQLANFATETPFLESDQQRNTNSAYKLTILNQGTTNELDPYMVDGTFMDSEFLIPDKRGIQNLPSSKEERRQRTSRGRFLKMYPDASNDIIESGIAPERMVANVASLRNEFKRRYKNFEESLGNYNYGGIQKTAKRSDKLKVTMDGTLLEMSDLPNDSYRADPVAWLSNHYNGIPRLSAPDHRIKVSSYGRCVPMAVHETNPDARYDAKQSSRQTREFTEKMKHLATVIPNVCDLQQSKFSDVFLKSKSKLGRNRARQETEDRERVLSIVTSGMTGKMSNSRTNENIDSRVKTNALRQRNEIKLNHSVKENIEQATRDFKKTSEDVRELVEETTKRDGLLIKINNKEAVRSPAKFSDMSIAEVKGDSRVIKNYGRELPKQVSNMYKVDPEDYKMTSKLSMMRDRKKRYFRKDETDITIDHGDSMQTFAPRHIPKGQRADNVIVDGLKESKDY